MIDKLRFKFIKITCIAVLAVLFAIIVTVNFVNCIENNKSLDSITEVIAENGGVLKKYERPFDDIFNYFFGHDILNDTFNNRVELPFSSRYFSVYLNNDMQIIDYNMDNIASVTEDDVCDITSAIIGKKSSRGWYDEYRYRLQAYKGGYLLVVLEATAIRNSVFTVFSITTIVGIIAFVIVFLFVTIFAKKAIAPIAQAYEKQKRFITDAGHELKTPLTVISANAEILSLTYGENEWCGGIEKQTDSMRRLIDHMIQMSKLDESETKMVFEPFDMGEAVYDTAMSFLPLAEKKGLTMSVHAEPNMIANGDESSIRQVVSILTDNAVKYCDFSGTVTVNAYKTKGHICVSVKNTYAEAEKLNVEKIFERFYREDKARTSSNSYGLGLSIARAIVEKHKGTICAYKGDSEVEIRLKL